MGWELWGFDWRWSEHQQCFYEPLEAIKSVLEDGKWTCFVACTFNNTPRGTRECAGRWWWVGYKKNCYHEKIHIWHAFTSSTCLHLRVSFCLGKFIPSFTSSSCSLRNFLPQVTFPLILLHGLGEWLSAKHTIPIYKRCSCSVKSQKGVDSRVRQD